MKTRLRSMVAGLVTGSAELVLFALCTLVLAGGTALVAARWICGLLGGAGNFLLNRVWAFGTSRAPARSQAMRFGATALAAVSMATACWYGIYTLTGWDPRLVHLASIVIVWMTFTFPVLRGWVFRPVRCGPDR